MNLDPRKGERVKILFYDGLVEEGIVYFWSDQKSAIQSKEGSLLVIQKTLEDVKCYQIIKGKPRPKKKPLATNVFVDKELAPTEYIKDPSLRAANLAELRGKLAEEERKRARAALTSFVPNGLQNNSYNYDRPTVPRKLQSIPEKFEPVSQHPLQEVRGQHWAPKKKLRRR